MNVDNLRFLFDIYVYGHIPVMSTCCMIDYLKALKSSRVHVSCDFLFFLHNIFFYLVKS